MNWTGKERRRFVRVKLPCKVIVHAHPQQVLNSSTENIGAGGVGVILEKKLDVRSMVGLQIYINNNEIMSCKGRVVWVIEKQSGAGYDTGIEFFDMKDEDRGIIKSIVDSMRSQKR